MHLEKIIQTVNYLMGKYGCRLNYTKLVKLVYLFDREALLRWDTCALKDQYSSLPQGPVLSGLLNLIRGKHKSRLWQLKWDQYFHRDEYDLIADRGSQIRTDELSPRELALIDELDLHYHDWPWTRFIDLKFKKKLYPEWQDPGQSSMPLTVPEVLKTHGRSAEDIARVMEEESFFDREESYFKSCCS